MPSEVVALICSPMHASALYSVFVIHHKSHAGLTWIGHMKVVHIEWTDSECSSGWEPVSSISSSPLIAHTVGFLLRELPDCLVVAHSYDKENDNYNGAIRIPIVSVVSITVLCGIRI